MLTKLWEQNKRFLIIVGSSLAVFLILNSLVGLYVRAADKALTRASQLEREIRELKKALSHRYWQEKTRLEDYETHEKTLRSELELPPEKELASFDAAAPVLQFNQAVSRIWGAALEKANRLGVAIPEKPAPEAFGIEPGDGAEHYKTYYEYLAVLRVALDALVEAGMAEIQRPDLVPETEVPIRLNNELVCRLQPVNFAVSGPFESFLKALKGVQQPGAFLQVKLVQLGPKRGDDRLLQGTLQFSGVRLAKASEPEKKGARKQRK